jgi:hypothetical protein
MPEVGKPHSASGLEAKVFRNASFIIPLKTFAPLSPFGAQIFGIDIRTSVQEEGRLIKLLPLFHSFSRKFI